MVLTNLIMGTRVPPQHIAASLDLTPLALFRGAVAGTLGGLLPRSSRWSRAVSAAFWRATPRSAR